jgi:CheY-like chemotaxis protein
MNSTSIYQAVNIKNPVEMGRVIEILLVEDNRGDVRLCQEALKRSEILINLSVARDGVEALTFLNRKDGYAGAPRPDLILLDLNLPKKDGREVLAEIKTSDKLKSIPVVILTTSRAKDDIIMAYNLHANSYITKSINFSQFIKVVRSVEDFWLTIATLPPKRNGKEAM